MSVADTGPAFGERLRHIGLVVDLLRLSAIQDVDAIRPLLHPQMRTLAAPGIAPSHPYQTREDFLAYFAEAQLNDMLVEPDAHEICFSGSGAVVVADGLRMTTADRADTTPAWYVYTFREGRIASLETHLSRELAHEAAGLPVTAA